MSINPNSVTGGRNETKQPGVDTPGPANPKTSEGVQAAMNFHNVSLGLKPFDPTKDKYNNAQYVENASGKPDIKTAREKFAPNADKPTTASGDPSKKLPEIIQQVDPAAASQALQAMFSALSLVRAMMNSSSPAPRRKTITDALSGALSILAKDLGFDKVIRVMDKALENDGLKIISEDYREIVKNAVAKLLADAIKYGANNIPVSKYPIYTSPITITVGSGVPATPVVPIEKIVELVPDLYRQIYYTLETDPHVGYISWVNNETNEIVYTVRKNGTPYYSNAEEEIFATCEKELAEDLRPYFIDETLTASILDRLLLLQDNNVQNNGMEKSMGKNAGVNVMGLLTQLLGLLGTAINLSKSLHLPNSVLNQGAINQTMEKYSKNMSIIKKMKQDSLPAFNLPGGLGALGGALGGLGGIGGALGGLGAIGSVVGVGNIAGAVGLATGNIGAISGVVSQISGINPQTVGVATNLITKIAS
jgi:hypothetical protein